MDVTKKLQCRAQLANPTGTNSSGESTYTDVTTIACYVYGSQDRVISRGDYEREITVDFKMLVGPLTDVAMEGRIENAVDPLGTLLFEEGRIISITPIVHYRKGTVAKELGIVRW